MPPRICRWTIAFASRIVPSRTRADWLALWQTGLENWCILVDRGELSMRSSGDVCHAALASAWQERFDGVPIERVSGNPVLLPSLSALILLVIALASRGFAYSRIIPQDNDRIFGHAFVLSFTLAASTLMLVFRGAPLFGRGWQFWGYLAAKTALALAALTMVWVEAGGWLRYVIPGRETSALIGGLAWTLLFMAAFIWLAGWCFADQSRRCPVCLWRLVSPVSIGTWSSVFEPATTELICPDGHGLLCAAENEGVSAHWTKLDATWKGL